MRLRLNRTRLAQELATKNITQNHWAQRLGLSSGHLSDLLNGVHEYPSARTREKLLTGLGLDIGELFIVEHSVEPAAEQATALVQAALGDRYAIDTIVGRGGMGLVYKGRDVRHARTVAVKVLDPVVAQRIGAEQFRKEIRTTAQLQHPHVLPLLDSGETQDTFFYVMPFAGGGSLRDRLDRDGTLPFAAAIRIAREIGTALDAAHTSNVVHCDVKPENIVFSHGFAMLADFGITRSVIRDRAEWRKIAQETPGTAAYVSPEQAAGERDLDGRSDLYSLACVVYELLTGRTPFEGANTQATVANRFTLPVTPIHVARPDVSAGVSRVIEKALEFDPEHRHRSVGRFLAALEHQVQSAAPESRAGRAWHRSLSAGVRTGLRISRGPLMRRVLGFLGGAARDFRLAARGVARDPRLGMVVAVILALGIGVNATMFGIVDRILLRPPPHITAPEHVHRIFVQRDFSGRQVTSQSLTYSDFTDFTETHGFRETAAFFRGSAHYEVASRRIPVELVTAGYFPLLGTRAFLGRLIGRTGGDPHRIDVSEAVLSHRFWRSEFGADSTVLGRRIIVGGRPFEIVGIAPPGFTGINLRSIDVWLPLHQAATMFIGGPWETSRGIYWLNAVARRGIDVPVAGAETAATVAHRAGREDDRNYDANARVMLGSLIAARGPSASDDAVVATWTAGVSVLLLIIAGANAATLLLARAMRRQREIAIRLALGVSRSRLVTHYISESTLLGAFGGVIAVAIAWVVGVTLRNTLLPSLTWDTSPVGIRTALFILMTSVVVGALAGLVPALHGRGTSALEAIGSGQRYTGRRTPAQTALITTQAAFSVVLLVGAGLFVQSLRAVLGQDMGMEPDRTLLVTLHAVAPGLEDDEPTDSTFSVISDRMSADEVDDLDPYVRAAERLHGMPGIHNVTMANAVPLSTSYSTSLEIPGLDSLPATRTGGPYIYVVDPDFFTTMGQRVIRGRGFTPDDATGAPVTVIGETMARLVWRDQDPIGECMRIGGRDEPCSEIIGVVQDSRRSAIVEDDTFMYYVLRAQHPEWSIGALFARAGTDATDLIPSITSALETVLPANTQARVRIMSELVTGQTRSWRLGANLFTLFGVLALLVTTVGVYSVTTYSVEQRTREIGVRTALGAPPASLARLVLGDGVKLLAAGTALGVAVVWFAGTLIEPMLFGVTPRDPPILFGALLTLVGVGVAASLIPALRAARLDANVALRMD